MSEPSPVTNNSSNVVLSGPPSKRPLSRRPSAPPPYTGPSVPNASITPVSLEQQSYAAPHPIILEPLRMISHSEVSLLPLPPSPNPSPDTPVQQTHTIRPHSPTFPESWQGPYSRPASPATTISSSPSATSTSSTAPLRGPSSIFPTVHVSRSRSSFRPFSVLRLSKATRHATAQIAESAAWQAAEQKKYETELARKRAAEEEAARRAAEEVARREAEEAARRAAIQADAKATAQSLIRTLISSRLPSAEERESVLSTCEQACENGGVSFSAALQEPFIEGQPPVYWAILNRPTASGGNEAASDSLVLALLDACRPLDEATTTSVRLACMLASDNALLQRLFSHISALSPLSAGDAMLLGPADGADSVHVEETRDGTGTFTAHIKIPRFRLRMRVSKSVKVVIAASERIWTLKFSMVVEDGLDGRPQSKWMLSLELADQSAPAWVDADLLIEPGHPQVVHEDDHHQPIFAIPLGINACELRPGADHAINSRLDDSDMGPHLLNESFMLVDANGTLSAQLSVRLATHHVPPLPPLTPDLSDTASHISSATDLPPSPTTPISIVSELPRTPSVKSKERKPQLERKQPERVFTTLRRGGR
ncbi:hypothetical protein BC834DRAFT_844152 [Gloeopeniophorella convolvens]|nr:hypothetical protein BC834DRAFT_844152 [Gloeopeniophorella convolvens]